MIITKTPYRISFFGGGTDYPDWYLSQSGGVLSTTIDKYCYLTCRHLPPFFNNKHRIVWSHIETVSQVAEILHPAVREGLRYLGFDDSFGIEIHHQGDLPARTGMGSSSSFAVGLIKALTALKGKMISKHELALMAIELEQNILKDNVGSQDQVAASYGGFNYIQFHRSGEIEVEPVILSQSRLSDLQDCLMMFYTGASRLSSEIAGQIISGIKDKQNVLSSMEKLTEKAMTILSSNQDIDDFGHLLHETWKLKRDLAQKISNPYIDKIYSKAKAAGALGGKLLGAGGSGFMVFYVPFAKQQLVKESLDHLLQVPFKFEHEGSSIIFYNPQHKEENDIHQTDGMYRLAAVV
ncbi:GHMP kinase [Desulfosarcina ovata subsp. sediminis]|uniref:GHMP kinase n=1 Tax=Desulfosarcina ovata subsp. sediminis TaxID=885957 RepID=A0A5K7ZC78_9BACT|nr:kinase [Desulfosarcina ovata]BBO79768.1 GHMP kinase [Desulfosarcina ovata subsp. sediminis]